MLRRQPLGAEREMGDMDDEHGDGSREQQQVAACESAAVAAFMEMP